MRIVLDTNVLISAALTEKGPPAAIVRAARARGLSVVSSTALLAELTRTITRPRLRRRISPEAGLAFVREIQQLSDLVEPAEGVAASRDPDDDVVLATAVAGEADVIVTGDEDLLTLGEHQGVPILSPAEFAAVLADPPLD